MTRNITQIEEGYRDVRWCPYLNEPFIIEYKVVKGEKVPHCPNCNGNFEFETHTFICHINKPHYEIDECFDLGAGI